MTKVRLAKVATTQEDFPQWHFPEFAFIGRSNVGKSSLINALLNQKVAYTSAKPGKTKAIHFFVVRDSWVLVDLPGYGFAKMSKQQRKYLQQLTLTYLAKRQQLINTFILIDFCVPIQKNDLRQLHWLGIRQIPFSIVFTKIDKVSKSKRETYLKTHIARLLEDWQHLPPYFLTSSIKREGINALKNYIEQLLKQYRTFVSF